MKRRSFIATICGTFGALSARGAVPVPPVVPEPVVAAPVAFLRPGKTILNPAWVDAPYQEIFLHHSGTVESLKIPSNIKPALGQHDGMEILHDICGPRYSRENDEWVPIRRFITVP